jgi:hypothetical protein
MDSVKNSRCLCRTCNVCVGQHDFSVKNTIDSKWQTERQQQQGEVFGSAHLADASSFFFGSWVPVVRCERLPALDIMHTWLLDGLTHVAHGGLGHAAQPLRTVQVLVAGAVDGGGHVVIVVVVVAVSWQRHCLSHPHVQVKRAKATWGQKALADELPVDAAAPSPRRPSS